MAHASPREQGRAQLEAGRYREAADTLADAVALNPSDPVAWRLLGGALSALGDRAGARAAFERVVVLEPSRAKNHFNLGLAYLKQGQRTEARTHLSHALQLDPHYEPARSHLQALEDTFVPPPVVPPPPPPPRYQPSPGGYVPPPTLGYGPPQLQQPLPAPAPESAPRTLVIVVVFFLLSLLFFWMRFSR